ncbi:MAG TPA: hypothetical protein VNQ90_21040 [Chthoniobacteraceae bacterium]|nr:hypothetical protein [Chthoniobacteraceae bacterium]
MNEAQVLEQIARASPRAQRASRVVRAALRSIRDRTLREKVAVTLATLERRKGSALFAEKTALRRRFPEVCERLAATLPYHPRWTAPAAAPGSHHPYPGGWLMHNATNLHTLQSLIATAATLRGLNLDADPLLAAMLLHDWAKPRMFFWNGWQMEVNQGELGHHVTALAEMTLRGFPREVLVALAGVHGGWWQQPEAVASFLESAADALDRPELAAWGKEAATRNGVFGWIARQGEASWYFATRAAAQSVRPLLRDWLAGRGDPEPVDLLEAMVWGWADELELADAHAVDGMPGFETRACEALARARAVLKLRF